MSELSVTKITDRVGTGKVNFSQGFKVAGTLDTTLAPTRTEGNTEPETPVNGDTWYDTDNDTYDVYINDEWKRFLGAGGAGGSWTVDVSNVTYDSVSYAFASDDTQPYGMALNADGTKIFVVGGQYDKLMEYSLSTAYDASTMSYTASSAGLGITNPFDVVLSADGTKAYFVDNANGSVKQFSFSTAFDVTTLSDDSVSLSVGSQVSNPYGLAMSSDGTNLYVVNISSPYNVAQYTLSTAFDLSSASYSGNSFALNGQETLPTDVDFNFDGSKMYATGFNSDSILQYTLSTPYDVSTASYDGVSYNFSAQEGTNFCVKFSGDGTKVYIIGSGDTLFQYSTGL